MPPVAEHSHQMGAEKRGIFIFCNHFVINSDTQTYD